MSGLSVELTLQRISDHSGIPENSKFELWVRSALKPDSDAMVNIRVVDSEESADLNLRYRAKDGPTNVLSFPADLPPDVDLPFLGDIVICAPLVEQEARQASKELAAHWAHLVIHGMLHLQGFDHEMDADADVMETEEIAILHSLGFPDPYR